MKKAHKIAFVTMLAAGLITSASADESDLWRNTAIHVNGTWTKATENGLSYGDLFGPATDEGFRDRRAVFVSPDTSFDYGLGLTYHFPCTKTRFFFHYDHFSDGHHSDEASRIINLGLPVGELTGVTGFGEVHNKSDEWTFGFDRRIAFGRCYTLDTAFFIEWDKVRRGFTESAFQSFQGDAIRATRNTYNRFRGFGPGIGLKGRGIPFCSPHFGIFGSFASTILYGKNQFESELHTETNVTFLSPNDYRLNPESTHSLVNKFDITFGIDYKRVFRVNCNDLQFGLALGMRYVNYINVFKNGNTFYNPLSPNNLSYAFNTGHSEDWGRVGPFLQIRLGGAEA